MTYGLNSAAQSSRGQDGARPQRGGERAWKQIDEQCRWLLVEQAMSTPRPLIGGFPIAL